MREGICSFSGQAVPKGNGITMVKADGKAFLYRTRKIRRFVRRKIKPRFITWTQAARTLLKKENVVKEQKIEIPKVVKIVRGFPSVPAHVIAERQERAATKTKEVDVSRKTDKIKDLSRGNKVYKSDVRSKKK